MPAITNTLEVIPTVRLNVTAATGTAGGQNQQANPQGALLVASSLPLNTEVARLGNTYAAGGTTAVAPVAALPTTAAHFLLFNGEPQDGTGKSYVIHRCGFTTIVSAGAACQMQLIGHLG